MDAEMAQAAAADALADGFGRSTIKHSWPQLVRTMELPTDSVKVFQLTSWAMRTPT